MRILCTNDDGIHAPGLKIVEEIARALSDDVWVVAPELDQSGVSHSLSLNDPLRLREVGPRHFAVRGTPTDCVIMGARHILGETMPDLVLSGVNKGRNVAEDVVYSGTIAGGDVGVRARAVVLGDGQVAVVPPGEVQEEPAIDLVVGMEGDPQQAALAAGRDEVGDVDERGRQERAVLDDADPATLLDDEEPPAAVARADDLDRGVEPGDDGRQDHRGGTAGATGTDREQEDGGHGRGWRGGR